MNVLVSDTSVLLNFLKINRLDLLERSSYDFFITEHVESEISDYYPQQFRIFQKALEDHVFHKTTLEHPSELDLFVQLSKNQLLGRGESSAIAVAIHRNFALSIDDVKAIKSAQAIKSTLPIFRTQDLVVLMLEQQLLEVAEADEILRVWASEHRFKLKIQTFADLVSKKAHPS